MDLRGWRHYVAGAMELILALLSLLSAATGALTGAPAPEAGMVQSVQAGAVPAGAVHAAAVAPLAMAASAAPVAGPVAGAKSDAPAIAAPRAIPLYADRRIE